jgi:fatty acid amide hydrolase 2
VVEPRPLGWPSDVDISKLEVFPLPQIGGLRVMKVVGEAVTASVRALTRRGARVREMDSHLFDSALALWATTMSEATAAGGPSFFQVLGDGGNLSLWTEIARTLLGRARYTLPALGLAVLEQVGEFLPRRLTAELPRVDQLRKQLEEVLGERGVIVTPPYPRTAPRHHEALLRPFDFIFTGIFSVLEFPVTQVPTGFDTRGMPLGVQVVAARGNDHLTIAAAGAIEQALGGWQMARVALRSGRDRGSGL